MHRMEDGRIPKDLLYGELEFGLRPVGRPKLRFKDVCKRDMLASGLPTDSWETHAADWGDWIPCVVWHSRRERQGWKLKPMKEERREKQRQTQQSVYHQRMSSISNFALSF